MKKAIFTILFSSLMIYLPCCMEQANGSFRLAKIASDVSYNPFWDSQMPTPEMTTLFSKPFRYLGRGAQAFVFESQDGRYVIKLFRSSPKIHPWRQFFRKNFLHRKDRRTAAEKRRLLFGACQLAYTKAADLTGLVYIHLNPTQDLPPSSYLINRLGRKIPINLNRYCFAIQKKGISVSAAFQKAIDQNDPDKYKRLVHSFTSLVDERISRGLCNLDKKMGENFGFLGEQAIEWDFGNYALNEDLSQPKAKEAEKEIFISSFHQFLHRTSPEWAESLNLSL